ncbi:MAG TPA: M48 family metallopeptidase [Methylomirabilota bacterium]|nr:M48 family metallopeptidase [Methylomirabilota bacterium]
MKSDWQADYLDGQTAIRHPATVRLMRQGLEVTTAGGWTRLWPYSEIRQTQGFYEGEQVRLERGGAITEALLISDVDFLLSLHEAAPGLSAAFHNPARRSRRAQLTVLAAVAVVAITAALYFLGIPALARFAANHVPVSWEQSLGQSIVQQLAPPARRCDDPRLRQAVEGIVSRLTAAAPGSPYAFRVHVVNERAVNAFAAPGGYVVVFRGLLERTQTPEELAGVLAHELQHVIQRHATRAIIQHASTGLLVAALTGDVTGPLAYGLEAARVLGQLRYSREAEAEADREGLRLLLAARIDPAGMIMFFDAMKKEEGKLPEALKYLSTHPASADRVAGLRGLAAASPAPPEKLLPDTDWAEVRRLCRGPRSAPAEEAPPAR